MKSILALILTSLLFLSATASSQTGQMSMKGMVDNVVNNAMQDSPGVAVAVHYQGQDYIYTYGLANRELNIPVTPDTIFDLASVTKVFTSSLLGIAINQGKVKLTDPVVKYLPALANTQGLPIDSVRLVDLATHTASFPRDFNGFGVGKYDQDAFYAALASWQPTNPIGSQYLYSNVGFGLLGAALGNAEGSDYYTALSANLLQPLGMTNTFVAIPSNKASIQAQGYGAQGQPATYTPGILLGGGALRSSIRDMLLYLDANLAENSQLTPTLQSALLTTQQPIFTVNPNFIMALGWQRIQRPSSLVITKNGLNVGFGSFIGFSPDKKLGVVVLVNKRNNVAVTIGNQILNNLI